MAASRSASAKMMFGFLPPSSSDTFLNIGAQVSATFLPVTVPPVKEIVPTFGCAVMAWPTFGPGAVNDVQNAIGQSRFATNLAEHICRHRRQFARFRHRGVPACDGGRDFPAQQIERQIPGRDEAGDAAGLAQRVVKRHAVGDVRLVLRVQDRGGEEAEIRGRARDVEAARKRERLAGIDRFGARELLEIALDKLGDAKNNPRAIAQPACATNWRRLSPPPRPRFPHRLASLSGTANTASRSQARCCRDTSRRAARRIGRR